MGRRDCHSNCDGGNLSLSFPGKLLENTLVEGERGRIVFKGSCFITYFLKVSFKAWFFNVSRVTICQSLPRSD